MNEARETQADWDELAGLWDREQGRDGDPLRRHCIYPWISSLIVDGGEETVLDAGCGNGSLCRALARIGRRTLGVDFSERMIACARAHPSGERAPIQYRQLDIAAEDFDLGESCTFVVAVFTLQDTPLLARAVGNLFGALNAGGRFAAVIEKDPGDPVKAHRTTARAWLDASDGPNQRRQRIAWRNGCETVTYVRPLAIYLAALRRAGFAEIRSHVLTPRYPALPDGVKASVNDFWAMTARKPMAGT